MAAYGITDSCINTPNARAYAIANANTSPTSTSPATTATSATTRPPALGPQQMQTTSLCLH